MTYPNSTINAIQWNDNNEVTYLDVSGAQTATETRIQHTKNTFKQLVLSGDADILPGLTATFLGGIERSSYDMPMDDHFYLEGYGDVVSDYTGGTYSLVNTYKWDTGNPANWHAHEIDLNETYQDTAFDNIQGSLKYDLSPDDHLSAGAEWRRFENSGYKRTYNDALLSQFKAGTVSSDISDYAQTYTGYSGQDWVIVDYDKALKDLGVDRESYLAGTENSIYAVEERTAAGWVQYDWNHQLGGIGFRGNVGGRYYHTSIGSTGVGTVSGADTAISVSSSYSGFLPAANFIFELTPNLQVRAAAARNINRPSLSALAVNGTVSVGDNNEISVSVGNPDLKPYKSTDLDLAVEYYFGKVGSITGGLFYKTLDGFIATKTVNNVAWSETGLSTSLLSGVTADTTVTSFSRPINLGKTDLWGLEFAAQSDFTFLPAPFDHFGGIVNFTYVDSKYDYSTVYTGGANTTLEGLSHINANATLYYQDAKFDARVSANYRSSYIYSASPVTSTLNGKTVYDQDLSGYAGTVYVDMSAHYKILPHVTLTLDGVNLTNQAEKQYSDSSKRLYVITRSGRTIMGGVRFEF
ncbi:TonB-dependent receptor [Novosphingobium sp. 9]|uniref:TonB-dependent receptor n=1 Tax=Novosphingobium sp. 9 TaxID=2025349 RepID=UPI0021B54786|nr:TonB-dependent receptor [Novosphingobium sp. 9]